MALQYLILKPSPTIHPWIALHGRTPMDEHVSMEEYPWINIRGSSGASNHEDWIVTLPKDSEEWMYPDSGENAGYAGRNISWFMVQNEKFMNYVPKEYIDPFYQIFDNQLVFAHLLRICSSSEYLNLVCNSCHYIRAPENQQWLMTVMNNKSDQAARFMINDLGHGPDNDDLKQLRRSIWNLIK